MENSQGFIKKWRKIYNHPLHPINRKREWTGYEAMEDLIMQAHGSNEPLKKWAGNKTVEIKRGQLDRTVDQLSKRWRWSAGKTHNFLKHLKDEKFLTLNVNRWFTVITIAKYDEYNPQNERKMNGKRTQDERKMNTYNERKESNERNEQSTKVDCVEPTPQEKMVEFVSLFLEKGERYEKIILAISLRSGLAEEIVRAELDKFMNHWCESTKSGKKQKWELQETFELERRLSTWFRNYEKYNKDNVSSIARVNY